jgi:hypothetical protein
MDEKDMVIVTLGIVVVVCVAAMLLFSPSDPTCPLNGHHYICHKIAEGVYQCTIQP